ncbi:RNA-binding family protein [Perilla frutescens var. hirtella]|uniref:RNA-binding family protein n=1 Tax=Perilla frutescens var. hirtella TaxID=608512 RepID=A0AAD4IT95_PERFH|nr:RNA-binding family protein [Perilla frutescens var. hirtella]
MEVVTGNEPTTRIRPGQSHELGRAHGLDSSDKAISRRHISLSVAGATNGDELRLQFEVLGRNPIYVLKDNEVKIFRRFERGEMGNGDMFCVSAKNPVWHSVRRIEDVAERVRRNAVESEFSGKMEVDFGFDGVEDLDQVGVDISGVDPVKEFGFVVEGHEFDSYPTKMIRDIKNWDWFLEEKGKNSDDDEEEGKNVKARRRGKRKKGAENDDDDEWSGESEDERVLMEKSSKAWKAKYMTRSVDHGKPSEKSPTRTKNGDAGEEDDGDEDEDDETLGGFLEVLNCHHIANSSYLVVWVQLSAMDYNGPPRNSAAHGEEQPHYGGFYEAERGNYGSIDNIDVSARLKHDSSSSEGKLFVGGIAWETPKESLSSYFSKYGEITNCVIMYDKISGRPRGFGFVTFADPEVAEKVLEENHVIDGRTVEVKRTVPRENVQVRGVSGTKKVFVGGLPVSLNEDDLNEYFSTYGNVVGHQIMLDRETGRSRGFGFVTFDNEDAVERVLSDGRMHEIGGKQVEIKRAEPKRSGFDDSSQSRPRHGGSSSNPPANSVDGSQGFAGGYGGKMGGVYGGYGGFGNVAGNYAAGALGFYPGYGGYGYGYGSGGPFYGGGAYGGGGFGVPVGYGGAAGYGVHNGYNHGGVGGEDEGFESNGNDGVNVPATGSGGEYGGSRGYGNGNTKDGRFHPYRK